MFTKRRGRENYREIQGQQFLISWILRIKEEIEENPLRLWGIKGNLGEVEEEEVEEEEEEEEDEGQLLFEVNLWDFINWFTDFFDD